MFLKRSEMFPGYSLDVLKCSSNFLKVVRFSSSGRALPQSLCGGGGGAVGGPPNRHQRSKGILVRKRTKRDCKQELCLVEESGCLVGSNSIPEGQLQSPPLEEPEKMMMMIR
jgi:hypothetical protein